MTNGTQKVHGVGYIRRMIGKLFGTMLVCGAALLWSCSSEVDLISDSGSTTVVYSVLNSAVDTQWVRINKTFIGDGNNLTYAALRDSSEYADDAFEGYVERLSESGAVLETIELKSTTRSDRMPGIFAGPEYKAYYFTTENAGSSEFPQYLNNESQYKMVLDFPDRPDVSAQTNVISVDADLWKNPQLNTNLTTGQFEWTLVRAVINGSEAEIPSRFIKIRPADFAVRYSFSVRLWYREFSGAGAETLKFYDWQVTSGEMKEDDETEIPINATSLFSRLEADLEPLPEGGYRKLGKATENGVPILFDFMTTLGNEELQAYINLNSPVTGIVQDRPVYSNVNNGIGLWGAGATSTLSDGTAKNSFDMTLEWFCLSEMLSDLRFCTDAQGIADSCDCPE